jgi:hypothetical protein
MEAARHEQVCSIPRCKALFGEQGGLFIPGVGGVSEKKARVRTPTGMPAFAGMTI